MNINDYAVMLKGLKKAYEIFQPFVGPNVHQDIEAFKRSYAVLRHNFTKTSRILKIKKHKRNKKNFVK